ncbi:MAG TPA: hypothetical protein VLB69_04015, partial [Rudaea sp.]|nr:hypothetical protein [Rudaea sp.]
MRETDNGAAAAAHELRRWRMGTAQLDERTMRLTVDGKNLPLDRSGCALLLCLARRAGETVAKDALLRAGWP